MKQLGIYILVFAFGFLLSSCQIHLYGVTNDYGKLDESHKEKVFEYTQLEQRIKGNIYKITGSQLRQEFSKNQNSILAVFRINCNPQDYNEFVIETLNLASERNASVYFIIDDYSKAPQVLSEVKNQIIYVIDNKKYKRIIQTNYKRKFFSDLLQVQIKRNEKMNYLYYSYYCFKGENFTEKRNELSKLN